MITDENIKPLTSLREFYQTRNGLIDSMHLFVLYDESKPEEVKFWNDYFHNLISKFGKRLKISITSNNESQKDLFQLFIDMKDKSIDVKSPSFDKMRYLDGIKYPCIALGIPHRTEAIYYIGISPFNLYELINKFYNFFEKDYENEKKIMFEKIKSILDSYPVVCFIKGTPQDPYCKFSKTFIEILNKLKIRYKAIDIFQDEKLRCYLRLYQNWRTYPQIYINGNIVGGVDKLKELVDSGEFMKLVPESVKFETLENEIMNKIKERPVTLFASNKEIEPCVSILGLHNVNFNIIDVGLDTRAKEILKKIANGYRTNYSEKEIDLPALLVNGIYIGSGIDLIDDLFIK